MIKLSSSTLLLTLLSACMGSADYDSAPGGNVGFGGAQDIGQFRDILDNGGIPGEETLDANGFFGEHYTELPGCERTLCVNAMAAVGSNWVDGSQQASIYINLTTGIDPADLERKPLNLVAVVDTSGSMAGERIDYARRGLDMLIDELHEGDRLALVTYDSNARVVFGFDLDAEDPILAMHAAVSELYASGSTNIHDGLRTAMEISVEAYDPARQNRVVLLSDGVATAGNTSTPAIIELAEDYIGEGIGLTTIGVGTTFNVELMRGLSERGAGNFYFLEDASAIEEVFTEELDFFSSPIAFDIELTVNSGAEYRLGEVVGTKLWQTQAYGGSIKVPAVFVASRTTEDPGTGGRRGGGSSVFVELEPTGVAWASQFARVQLRYRLPDSEEYLEDVVQVMRPFSAEAPPAELALTNDAMADLYATYNLFLGLRRATRLASADYSCAAATLAKLHEVATSWNLEHEDPDVAADLLLVAQFEQNLIDVGATPATLEAGGACAYDDGDYYDDYYGDDSDDDYYGDDYHGGHYACSASGSSQGTTYGLVAVVLACALRRRRWPAIG